jgi:NAD(P)H dehydrogenase (quinone)
MPTAHIVLAHPEPQSYSAHLARTAQGALLAAGWRVTLIDLYAIGFEPAEGPLHFKQRKHRERFDPSTEQRHAFDTGRLPSVVQDEIRRLEAADLLVLQFPLWWYGPPAILKGWFDRVLAYGATYTSKMRFETGKFCGKRAIISVASGGETESFVLGGRNGDIRQSLWPVHYSLHYVGFTVVEPLTVMGVSAWSPDDDNPAETARLGRHAERVAVAVQSIETRATVPFNAQKDWTSVGAPQSGHEDPGPFVYRAGSDPRPLFS